jgi:broad specificity phosphatase PhoE
LTSRITFVSHALTAAIRRAVFPSDEPLEDGEFEKLQQLKLRAPKAEQILCGPEQRARQTAEALGLAATVVNELRDCDYGAWRGRSLNELQSSDPEGLSLWLTHPESAPHGGESVAQIIDRSRKWLDASGQTGHVIAVTHPAIIRATIVHVLSAPAVAFWRIDTAPATVTDLRFNGRNWTVRSLGCPVRS